MIGDFITAADAGKRTRDAVSRNTEVSARIESIKNDILYAITNSRFATTSIVNTSNMSEKDITSFIDIVTNYFTSLGYMVSLTNRDKETLTFSIKW